MCNLYDIGSTPGRKGINRWEKSVEATLSEFIKIYGIRKTDRGAVITGSTNRKEQPQAQIMRWGFSRPFNPAINNARIEKLSQGMWKPSWVEGRRCVIPVSTFYEWSGPKGAKQTHAIQAATAQESTKESHEEPTERLWMAGLWETHPEAGPSYTMLTRAAQGPVASIHDRMPVILNAADIELYLNSREAIWNHEINENPRFIENLTTFRCLNPLKTTKPGPPIEDSWLL